MSQDRMKVTARRDYHYPLPKKSRPSRPGDDQRHGRELRVVYIRSEACVQRRDRDAHAQTLTAHPTIYDPQHSKYKLPILKAVLKTIVVSRMAIQHTRVRPRFLLTDSNAHAGARGIRMRLTLLRLHVLMTNQRTIFPEPAAMWTAMRGHLIRKREPVGFHSSNGGGRRHGAALQGPPAEDEDRRLEVTREKLGCSDRARKRDTELTSTMTEREYIERRSTARTRRRTGLPLLSCTAFLFPDPTSGAKGSRTGHNDIDQATRALVPKASERGSPHCDSATAKDIQSAATEDEARPAYESESPRRGSGWIISAAKREGKPRALPPRQPGGMPNVAREGCLSCGKNGKEWEELGELEDRGHQARGERGTTNAPHQGNLDGTSGLPVKGAVRRG
ncbi:hypothetical protein BJY52DRAFT_1230375 [Lactarius psammicola]|nr:hypothetical protein BJY52DRAFT_1230375 [Lactarius psammicola]